MRSHTERRRGNEGDHLLATVRSSVTLVTLNADTSAISSIQNTGLCKSGKSNIEGKFIKTKQEIRLFQQGDLRSPG